MIPPSAYCSYFELFKLSGASDEGYFQRKLRDFLRAGLPYIARDNLPGSLPKEGSSAIWSYCLPTQEGALSERPERRPSVYQCVEKGAVDIGHGCILPFVLIDLQISRADFLRMWAESETIAAKAAREPLSVNPDSPPSIEEIRALASTLVNENGGYMPQRQGASAVRARYPGHVDRGYKPLRVDDSEELFAEANGTRKPGPKGPHPARK